MYSTGRAVKPRKSPDYRNMCIAFLPNVNIFSIPCSDLRTVGPNSNVSVFDAKTMKPKRIESPTGEILVVFKDA